MLLHAVSHSSLVLSRLRSVAGLFPIQRTAHFALIQIQIQEAKGRDLGRQETLKISAKFREQLPPLLSIFDHSLRSMSKILPWC